MSDHGGLTGKRVLIFAANGRLASAAARHFAASGAQVLLSGRNQEAVEAIATQIGASGGKAQTAVVDPTSPPQVRDYLTAVAGHGPVDVVFNGVGMPGPATGYGIPYDELDPKMITDAVALVVGSQFLTAREAARLMAPAGRGSIITIASTNGRSGRPHTGGIGVIAGAVESLALSMASEYGPAGVRVNHVRATRVANQQVFPDNALGRPITAEEVAATIAWLGSDQATGITGQIIEVSGGERGLAEVPADAAATS